MINWHNENDRFHNGDDIDKNDNVYDNVQSGVDGVFFR